MHKEIGKIIVENIRRLMGAWDVVFVWLNLFFFSKDSQILVKDIIGELYDLETHFWDAFSRFQVDARLKDLRKQLKELNFAYAQSEDWLKVRCFKIVKYKTWVTGPHLGELWWL